jgi:hypothetical protein
MGHSRWSVKVAKAKAGSTENSQNERPLSNNGSANLSDTDLGNKNNLLSLLEAKKKLFRMLLSSS